ncbi:MAG TPA: DUF998 domain-containing protein [Methanobacterium sp.]
MKKIYPSLGIIGPLIYITVVFMGSTLHGDYSPFYNSISELLIPGSPNLLVLSVLFGIYNVSLFLFSYGMFKNPELARNKSLKAAAVMIALIGILGLLFIFFPQDPRGAPATLAGNIHLVLAGITSPLTILAVFLTGFSFRKEEKNKPFVWYSYISVLLILISGGMTAASIAGKAPTAVYWRE